MLLCSEHLFVVENWIFLVSVFRPSSDSTQGAADLCPGCR